jgi:hypothetical protein
MFKKARKRYTAITAPSCDYDYCQNNITTVPAQSVDSEVSRRD